MESHRELRHGGSAAEDAGVNGLQRADERGRNLPSVATDGVRSRYRNAVYEPRDGITR